MRPRSGRPNRTALVLVFLATAGPACAPRTAPGPVTIVADPGPFGSIAAAADAEIRVDWWDSDHADDDACTAAFAAVELQRWLPECLGLRADQVTVATSMPATGDVVTLRRTSSSTGAAGAYRVHLRSTTGRRVVEIESGNRAGLLHGAYGLLEQLGLRFLAPGDSGVARPRPPYRWPRRLDRAESPAFATRGFWAWEPRGNRDFLLWMARNRLDQWTAADTAFVPLMKKLGFRLTGGGHSIQGEFLDPARHAAAHPEWYGLHAARRSPRIAGDAGDNFCTSNAAARDALADALARGLRSGSLRHVDDLELWPLDQGRWCECDSCDAQGSPVERWRQVVRSVAGVIAWYQAEGMVERPVEISAPAYLETLEPPARFADTLLSATVTFFPYFRCYAHALEDPACTEMNQRLARAWKAWRGKAGRFERLGVCEYYNVGSFKSLPLLFPHVMAADFAAYRRAGASRILYMHAPTRLEGSWALQHALFAVLAWNPHADVDSLIHDFCRRAYPTRSANMRAFYRELETATSNIVALQHAAGVFGSGSAGGRLAETRLPVFPLRHLREHAAPDTLDRAASLDEIDQAMAAARRAIDDAGRDLAGEEHARIAEVERRFAYGEAVFQLYSSLIRTAAAHRAGDGDGARRAFAVAATAAGRLRGIHDLVQVAASHANAADGLEASGVVTTYDYFARLYGR